MNWKSNQVNAIAHFNQFDHTHHSVQAHWILRKEFNEKVPICDFADGFFVDETELSKLVQDWNFYYQILLEWVSIILPS